MKVTDEQRKMVSAMCEWGTFIDIEKDCDWCEGFCHKKELNPQQQIMESLMRDIENPKRAFRKAVRKAARKVFEEME